MKNQSSGVGWRNNLKLYLYSSEYLIYINPSIEALISSKPMFDKFEFDLSKYINCGNVILNDNHRDFLEKVKAAKRPSNEFIKKGDNEKWNLQQKD